jgi:hypothetical protein
MATTFMDKLEAQAFRAGLVKGSDEAKEWFKDKLKEVKAVNRQQLLKEPSFNKTSKGKMGNAPLFGRMFMYFYDPKLKKELPYYDRFPLIFLMDKAEGGFYGLNLHYLPPKQRAIFFDRFVSYTNNKKFDESTRVRMKYDTLKKASKLKFYKPCFKHYLNSHVRSNIVEIPASEWDVVLHMPTEFFMKKKTSAVWADSKKQF